MINRVKKWISSQYIIGIILMFFSASIISNAQESSESVKDVDGNVYTTVRIGKQIWLAENLKTTRYSDNTEITLVIDDTIWTGLTTPAFCWYNNDTTNKSIYGALYNWYTVNTNKLCPIGWHVPAKDEWMTLAAHVNDNGGKLKEPGITHWYNPNVGATNESGFSALLNGFRSRGGAFYSIKKAGFWWSATECVECDAFPEWNFNDAMTFSLGTKSSGYGNQHDNKLYGYSIRCLKDN